jgi:small-conductance mechanosensitive channel
MRPLRTAQDIRSAPRGLACRGPANEQWAYALLTRLARERQRLVTQQASWQRKLGHITRGLAEIDAQAERLQGQLPETAGRRQVLRRSPPQAEIEFRY